MPFSTLKILTRPEYIRLARVAGHAASHEAEAMLPVLV
jgi:hypothetical protein